MGHFRYGFHRHTQRTPRYFTFVRNPLDQVVSHYYYSKDHPEKFKDLPNDISDLIDFAHSAYGYNLQTRFISGIDEISGRENEALNIAKNNLKDHFEFIGITERFDLSIYMLALHLKWPIKYFTVENRGRQVRKAGRLTDREKRALEEILQTDILLYKYSLELFEKQLIKVPYLNIKFRYFLMMNKVFQALNPMYIRMKNMMGISTEDSHS